LPFDVDRNGVFGIRCTELHRHFRSVQAIETPSGYNDGPPEPGKPLGPFFELETSSPALSLAPEQQYVHVHRTFHFVGPDAELDRLARATIKVGLDEIKNAFLTTGQR
jgi:hypothetical protein